MTAINPNGTLGRSPDGTYSEKYLEMLNDYMVSVCGYDGMRDDIDMSIYDGTVEKVIPAKAGIHLNTLDPRFRGDDRSELALFRQPHDGMIVGVNYEEGEFPSFEVVGFGSCNIQRTISEGQIVINSLFTDCLATARKKSESTEK